MSGDSVRLSKGEVETFYDITTRVEEYDPGDDTFAQRMELVTGQLNDMDGQDSMSYEPVLRQLNEEWEHHGGTVTLTGRVYAAEQSIVELGHESWDGPYSDARGTYFVVDGAEFTSEGIFDAMQGHPPVMNEDSSISKPVLISYGLNPSDLEADYPTFFASPADVLHATYDSPTYDAIATRLHAEWPNEMRYVDAQLDAAGGDAHKLVKALRKISKRLSDRCIESEEFGAWMVKYIEANAEFDNFSPYLVTFEGRFTLTGVDDEANVEHLLAEEPITRYLQLKGVGTRTLMTRNGGVRSVEFSLTFDEPTSRYEEEDVASRVLIPSDSIRSIQSLRPTSSLRDLSEGTSMLTYTDHARIDVDGDLRAAFTKPVWEHPRRLEERRLSAFMDAIDETVKEVCAARRYWFRDEDDARAESQRILAVIQQRFVSLGLENSDVVRIAGRMSMVNSKVESGHGSFSVDIHKDVPIGQPELTRDVIGFYDGLVASLDEAEDEEGSFWLIAPRMKLVTADFATPLVMQDGVVLQSASARSTTLANFDGSTMYESPHLEIMRHRQASLARLAMTQRGSDVVRIMSTIDQAFMSEMPIEAVKAGRGLLRSIRKASRMIVEDEQPNEAALEALRHQLIRRSVFIKAESWINGIRYEPSIFKGGIEDVMPFTTPDGKQQIVASLELAEDDPHDASDKVVLVVLDTVNALAF